MSLMHMTHVSKQKSRLRERERKKRIKKIYLKEKREMNDYNMSEARFSIAIAVTFIRNVESVELTVLYQRYVRHAASATFFGSNE